MKTNIRSTRYCACCTIIPFVFMLLVFMCGQLRAESPHKEEKETLVITSTGQERDQDVFRYDMKREVIIQGGGVHAHKGTVSLECEALVAYMNEEEVYAEGNVILTDGDLRLTAQNVYYNFRTHRGVMKEARIVRGLKKKGSAVEWVVYADRLIRRDRETFEAESAWFTTCSFKEPHYRLKCSSVTIKPGKLLVGRNMVLFLGNVPVFYYPYFRHDLEHDWLPQDFDLGTGSVLGDYLKSRWRIYSNDVLNLLLRIDITAKRGTGLGTDLEYSSHTGTSGLFQYYAVNDKQSHSMHRDRYVWHHYQKIDDADMIIKADAYSYSDTVLAYDFFDSEYADQREYTPYIHWRQLFSEGEFNLVYSGQTDEFQTVLFRSPALLLGIGPYSLGRHAYFAVETYSTKDGIDYGTPDEDAGFDDFSREKIDSRFDCTVKTELGWLFCDLSAGFVWSWYDEYLEDVEHRARTHAYHEVRVGTTLTGDFGRCGAQGAFSGIRHIIQPCISVYRGYKPSIVNSAVEQLDLNDDLREDGFLSAGFVTSVDRYSDGSSRNLFHMKAFFRYFSDEEFAAANNGGEEWGDIGFELSFVPLSRLGFYSAGEYDAGEYRFEELFTGLRWKYSSRLAFHAEDYRLGDSRNQILGMDVLANEKWSMGGYLRYDEYAEEYAEWRWFVTRVFHMWECTFTSRYDRQRDERAVGVGIRLIREETDDIALRQGSITAADFLDDYMFFSRY